MLDRSTLADTGTDTVQWLNYAGKHTVYPYTRLL